MLYRRWDISFDQNDGSVGSPDILKILRFVNNKPFFQSLYDGEVDIVSQTCALSCFVSVAIVLFSSG